MNYAAPKTVLECLTRNRGRAHDAHECAVQLGVSVDRVLGDLATRLSRGEVREVAWRDGQTAYEAV